MTNEIQVALIVSIPPTLAAAATVWISYNNHVSIKKVSETADRTEAKSSTIETNVNWRFTELLNALLKLTKESSFIAGEQSEKDKAK